MAPFLSRLCGLSLLLSTMLFVGGLTASEVVTVRFGGSTLRGELIRVSKTEVVLKVNGKEQAVPAALMDPKDYFACAKAVLDAKDAKGHFELGEWCQKKGLDAEAKELFAMAAVLDPKVYGEKAKAAEAGPAKAVSPAAPDPVALIAQLGAEEGDQREAAMQKLAELGEKVAPALEAAAKETKDDEVRARVKSLLTKLRYKREIAKLTEGERAIADLAFGEGETPAPGSLNFRVFGSGSFTVMEVGSLRIGIADQGYNGSSSCTLSQGGGGTSSVKAGSLSMTSSGGKTAGSFRGINFTIEDGKFKVGDKSFPIGEDRLLVLLKKDGAYDKEVKLPGSK